MSTPTPGLSAAPVQRPSPGRALGPTQPARLALGETGLSGTTNYAGQLYTETNPALINDAGYGRPGTRVWGEWERLMRTDSAIETALNMTVAPLRDATVSVRAPKRTGPAAPAQVAYVEANFTEWLEPLWPDVAQQIGRYSLGVGFSLHEVCWGVGPSEYLPGGQGYRVVKLAQRLPSTLEYNGWIEKDGELVEVRQRGVKDGRYFSQVPIPAEKLLLVTWNREGNNYAGYSAFRPVYYLAKVREHLLRILGIGHQREALGVPMASMDRETRLSLGQRRALRRVLENLVYHENAAVVLPAGVTLEWFNSPGANKGHVLDTWKQLGIAILGVVGAQQAALGTGDTGSRAVGEVHDANKNTFIQAVKANIEAAFNGVGRRPYTGLVRKLVEANWGPQPSYPRLELSLPVSSLPPAEMVASVVEAVTAGVLTVTAEDENRLRKALGLATLAPEIREKLKATALPAVASPPTAAAPGQATAPGAPLAKASGLAPPRRPGEEGAPPASSPGRAVAASRDATGAYVPRRPLKPHETHLAWGDMDSLLSTAKEAFEAAARPLLVEALVRVIPQVREAMADGNPSEVAALELPFEKLAALVDEYLASLRAQGAAHVQREAQSPARQQALEEKRAEGKATVALSRTVTLARKRGRLARELAVDTLMQAQREMLLRRMRARTIDSLTRAAIEKVRTGGDPQDIVADVIQEALETRALRQDAAGITTAAFNAGREEAAARLGTVRTVRLSAVLDEVTCEYCERMDGAEFAFGSAGHDEHVPPLRRCEGRDKCRCLLIYETEGFAVEETYPEDNVPEAD